MTDLNRREMLMSTIAAPLAAVGVQKGVAVEGGSIPTTACDDKVSTHLDQVSFRGLGQIVKNIKSFTPDMLYKSLEQLGRLICCIAMCDKMRRSV